MDNLQPLSIEDFRAEFPEFTEELYPDPAVKSRLAVANLFFQDPPWTAPDVRNHAMGLFTAHFLMMYGSKAAGGTGSGVGGSPGLVASKSVDGASISYDPSSVSFADAGFWNLTHYGQELFWLMQILGAGAIQL